MHRDSWLKICAELPETLIAARVGENQIGPLQGLIDELEFNFAVASQPRSSLHITCPFRDRQFTRAIEAGAIAVLPVTIKKAIYDAYLALGATGDKVTAWVSATSSHPDRVGHMLGDVSPRLDDCSKRVEFALSQVNSFLR